MFFKILPNHAYVNVIALIMLSLETKKLAGTVPELFFPYYNRPCI